MQSCGGGGKSSEYNDNRLFNGVLWLGALECMENICERMNDQQMKEQVILQFNKTKNALENNFWNKSGGYYNYNEKLDYLMADAMIGERYIDVLGLPALLNEERMSSHYKQSFRRLVLALTNQDGDGIGDLGTANALTPESKPALKASEFTHEFEVWTGISYSYSANLYHWGKMHNDGALMADALLTAYGLYKQTWLNDKTAYWFNTPEAWRLENVSRFRAQMYQRARAIWEVLNEVSPISQCR